MVQDNVIETKGVYQLIVGKSIRNPEKVGNFYLIYNKETDVVEEECTYAPQAFAYMEQLSAEWDARVDANALAKAEANGSVKVVASLRKPGYDH